MELWDIITPSALTRFSREVPIPQTYNLGAAIPDRSVNSFRARIRDVTRTIEAAKFRSYNAENFIARRPVVLSITDLTLPPFGQKLPLTEQEILEQAIVGSDPNGDVVAQIYDDAETNVRATRARAELAKGDLLADGAFTLTDENGLTLEADFGLDPSHTPALSGTALWSATGTATPLTDELGWMQQMIDDGGGTPVVAYTARQNLTALMQNAEYRAAYWGGNAGQQINLDPTQVQAVRDRYGLPPIVINDTKVQVRDGSGTTTQRVIPDDVFILVGDGAAEFQWGLTAQALEVAAGGADVAFTRRDAPGIFTAAYKEIEPAARWTSTYACGMPLLLDKNRLLTATVR